MKSNVYFHSLKNASPEELGETAGSLLSKIISEEKPKLESEIPLKVHFGEKGNKTYIKPPAFDKMIDLLEQHDVKCSFIETNVMYKGERTTRESHLKLAEDHGFRRLPITIADGDRGEDFYEVEISKKHFKSCKIGKEFAKYKQILVCSHFKGHGLAGFGGAIKNLAMGFASRGGKIAQHVDAKPFIIPFLCVKCKACKNQCPVHAISLEGFPKIDKHKCVGCGACMPKCKRNAIQVNVFKLLVDLAGNRFAEKLTEYGYAAQKGKKHIYINFAANITPGCDCEGHPMKSVIEDIGVFASLDPVSIDQACFDKSIEKGKKFGGSHILEYAAQLGMGNREYNLIEV
ncbi:MAG: DUF362 domain-containing protein [Firmicutes bacterium]|nr:DUF362 domain-containing protein [Bacillota bacterium]